MFGVGTPEIIAIVLAIFFLYGPDKLPEVIRKVAKFLREIKSMTDDVTHTVSQEIRKIEHGITFEEPKHLVEQSTPKVEQSSPTIEQNLISQQSTVSETPTTEPVKEEIKDEPKK